MVITQSRPENGTPEIRLSAAARALEGEPDHRVRRWVERGLIAIGSLLFLLLTSLFLLGLADFNIAANGSQDTRERIQGYEKGKVKEVTDDTKSAMPVFGPDRLSESDLDDIVRYLQTLKGFDPAVQ